MNLKKITKDKNNQIMFMVIMFFSFTICVYAPLEMYIGNIAEFWFKLSDILWLVILAGGILFSLLCIVGIFLSQKAKTLYIAFVFGIALSIYVQGNFLNLNMGVLNGADRDFGSYSLKFISDFIIWCIFIVVICTIVKKSKRINWIKYIASFLTLIQLVSLLILCVTSNLSKNNEYLSAKDQFLISKNNNIIVFVLDMFDNSYFPYILEKNPQIKEELSGFTYFDNAVGSYSSTNHSLSFILTGKYHKNETSFPEYIKNAFEGNELYEYLLNENYNIDLYTPEEYAVPAAFRVNVSNNCNENFMVSDYMVMAKLLYKFVSLKYMPNICKKYLKVSGDEFNALRTEKAKAEIRYDYNNFAFYNALLSSGLKAENSKNAFKFYHVTGAHFPYLNDENCVQVKEGEATHIQAAEGAFKIVEKYIKELKKLNKYEDSTIVVLADHGWYDAGVLTNPLLLVKPQSPKTKELEVSHAPVSQDDLHSTILKSISAPEVNGKSMFEVKVNESRERYFYSYDINFHHPSGNLVLTEFLVPSENNNVDNFLATGFKYLENGEYVDISQYAPYKLGTMVRFKEDYDASYWFDYGWGKEVGPVQKHAQMSLTLDADAGEKIFASFYVEKVYGEKQRVMVKSSDTVLYDDFIFPGNKGFEFEIPKEVISNSKIKLQFEFPDAFSERDTNEFSHDAKKLSVLLGGFSFNNYKVGLGEREYEKYNLGNEILFNEVINGTKYFLYGIGVNEPQFGVAWSSGKKAEFLAQASEEIRHDLNVYIELGLIHKDSQHIIIKGTDGSIYYDNLVNPSNAFINFTIPKENTRDGILRFWIEYPNAEKSKLDDRCLSIAFKKIVIK